MSTDTKAKVIKMKASNLPLSCPTGRSDLGSLHPRVFIPLRNVGDQETCPYCGATYLLVE